MSATSTAPASPQTDGLTQFFLSSAPAEQPTESPTATTAAPSAMPTTTETPSGTAEGDQTKPKSDTAKAPEIKPEPTAKDKDDKIEKRLRDKDAYIGKLSGQVKDLQTQMTVLQQKLDGTYQEPAAPTPEQAAAVAKLQAKAELSRTLAMQTYGEETVTQQVLAEGSPYRALEQAHPWVFHRVVASEHPVEEALTILKEHQLFEQWGRDPDTILQKAEALLRPKLMKEFAEAAKGMGIKPGAMVPGLSGVRGESEKAKTPLPPGQSAFDLTTLSARK